jgi:hypothetical protein
MLTLPKTVLGVGTVMRIKWSLVEVLLGLFALSLLVAGAVLYYHDRPPGATFLLPFRGQGHVPGRDLFGAIGGSLPSFFHTAAFAILSALALPRGVTWATGACAFWVLINTVFEIGQHRSLGGALQTAITHWSDGVPFYSYLGSYFANGFFDVSDIVFSWIGGLFAWTLIRAARPSEV